MFSSFLVRNIGDDVSVNHLLCLTLCEVLILQRIRLRNKGSRLFICFLIGLYILPWTFFFLVITCKLDEKQKSRLRHFRSGKDTLENWFSFVLSLTVFKLNFIGHCYFINYHYYCNWFEEPARVTRMWETNLGNCWNHVYALCSWSLCLL